MNKKTIITTALVIIAAALAFRAGISPVGQSAHPTNVEWRNFADGMNLSRTTNKKLLVDVYTDWCGWCKTMDKETYSQDDIISYITDHFIPVRLNAESQEVRQFDTVHITDAELADAFGVTGYPTTIFITSTGQPITSIPGYIQKDEFKKILHYVAEEAYTKMDYEQYKNSSK
ncbi:MAG TPA: thioredoxin fold domain-containing protein [Candidatus Kapabacteria bacterium]|nr:thioredoxin fold domain-containing protein [Candidatus Kapabacteria bacterium]